IVHVARLHAPFRAVQREGVGNQLRVGLVGIAHPDPDPALALHDGIRAHAGLFGYLRLPGDFDTDAPRVELEAVIHAPDGAAFLASERQRRPAMTAAVL